MTRFAWLLIALVALFVAAAVAGLNREARQWFDVIEPVAYAGVMLAAVAAVSTSRWGLAMGVLLCVPAVAVGVWSGIDGSRTAALAQGVLTLIFLAFVTVRIVLHLFQCDRVDADTLCAAACAFLVAGVAWAAAYSVVYDLSPDAFRIEGPAGERSLSLSSRQSVHVLYFSFVTLTTLGYGDVIPLSAPARVLAMLEASAGQLYLAVLVARLVGLHLRPRTPGEQDDVLTGGEGDKEAT